MTTPEEEDKWAKESATLSYEQNNPLPLMFKASFEKVTKPLSGNNQKYLKEQADKMYPADDTIPAGILVLSQIMRMRRHEHMGYNLERALDEGDYERLGIIGSGSFGVVLSEEATKVEEANGDGWIPVLPKRNKSKKKTG